MLRSLFLAVGIMLIVVGIESMFIDSANLHAAAEPSTSAFNGPSGASVASTKQWQPGEKFPFAMLAVGAIVVVYSNTLPKRFANS